MPIGICNKPGNVRTELDRTAYQVEMIAKQLLPALIIEIPFARPEEARTVPLTY